MIYWIATYILIGLAFASIIDWQWKINIFSILLITILWPIIAFFALIGLIVKILEKKEEK